MISVVNNKFKDVLQPLTTSGWQIIKENDHEIHINKKYSELENISIVRPSSNIIHITLPIKNSNYSFYKRHTDIQQSLCFLQNYVSELI
jgi:hypothetical protein